ncbi:RidA family protein [Methylobacterium sp. J-077]|uniref:RidA family protein n=1 Tax=Methylobacterium sp. J-077 TaxID=2836656 RepID=UPI001FB8F6B3|nr:RidA family protein [Methylobacterium sp. J-077]MCJ2127184.1 RidA family protein [Methylobacterium sp. J-077]
MDINFQNPGNLKHRSDTVIYNGVAYVSGAVPSDVSVDIAGQTDQVLAELDARLARAGTDKSNILSATIWLEDVNGDAAAFNQVWNAWVAPGRLPARACVQAALQVGARVEVAIIAAVPNT